MARRLEAGGDIDLPPPRSRISRFTHSVLSPFTEIRNRDAQVMAAAVSHFKTHPSQAAVLKNVEPAVPVSEQAPISLPMGIDSAAPAGNSRRRKL